MCTQNDICSKFCGLPLYQNLGVKQRLYRNVSPPVVLRLDSLAWHWAPSAYLQAKPERVCWCISTVVDTNMSV